MPGPTPDVATVPLASSTTTANIDKAVTDLRQQGKTVGINWGLTSKGVEVGGAVVRNGPRFSVAAGGYAKKVWGGGYEAGVTGQVVF